MSEGRISPPADYESLLDQLTESSSPLSGGRDFPLFDTKQKALMFAAALGRHLDRRQPLDKKGTAIRYDIFQRALDDEFISALSVADEGTLEILDPNRSDERIRIFEEYAHAGLAEIKSRCVDQDGDPLQLLAQLIEEAQVVDSDEVTGIDPTTLRNLMG